MNDELVGTCSVAAGVAGPHKLAVAVDNEVSIFLVDEDKLVAGAVTGGRSDGVAAVVRDEVAVLLKDVLNSIVEREERVLASRDVEVTEAESVLVGGCYVKV